MKHLFWLLIPLLMLVGCKSQQKSSDRRGVTTFNQPASANASAGALYTPDVRALASKQGAWTTLRTGGNITFKGSQSFSSGMQMQMERGKYIYISLRPMLGIEVGRFVVYDDKVMLVDKVHKQYIVEDASVLTNGVPITIETLQDIFLGRIHVLGSGSLNSGNAKKLKVEGGADGATLVPTDRYKGFTYSYAIDRNNAVTALEVRPAEATAGMENEYRVNYSNSSISPAGYIAQKASIATILKNKPFNISLNLKDLKWNQELKPDLSEPDGYAKMSIDKLFLMF